MQLIVILLLVFLFAYTYKYESKYSPVFMYNWYWGIQLFIIAVFFSHSFNLRWWGILYILAATLFFTVGGGLARKILVNVPTKIIMSIHYKKGLADLFLICLLVISTLFAFSEVYNSGLSLRSLLNANILLEMNHDASVMRYANEVNNSLFKQISRVFMYTLPLFGGFYFALTKYRKIKILCIAGLFPSFFISMTQSVKSGFMTSVFLFFIGLFVASFVLKKEIKLSFNLICKGVFFFLFFLALLFVSMILRTGQFDIDTAINILDKFTNYAVGHIGAFDIWFSDKSQDVELSLGVKTFYGVSNTLGVAVRDQGLYSDGIYYGLGRLSNLRTNVFTAFRPLIEDFGVLGSLISTFIAGFISNIYYMLLRKNRKVYTGIFILFSTFFYISWSFVTSVWAYASYILAVLLAALLVKLILKINICK